MSNTGKSKIVCALSCTFKLVGMCDKIVRILNIIIVSAFLWDKCIHLLSFWNFFYRY